VDGKNGPLAVNIEDVDVGEGDVANRFRTELVPYFLGVTGMPIGKCAAAQENVFDIFAFIQLDLRVVFLPISSALITTQSSLLCKKQSSMRTSLKPTASKED